MATPPVIGPLGFISDLHGNLRALNAVLEEFARRDVKRVYVAGDLLLGGKDEPLAVWKSLDQAKARCIRGLSDTALCTIDPSSLTPTDDAQQQKVDAFMNTHDGLGELLLERLRRLPDRIRIPMVDGREIVMVHGSPIDASTEMSHDLSDDELITLVGDDPADIVVCGATHVPFQRQVADDLHIVNVGSAGAAPEGNVAHFTVLMPHMDRTDILQDWVEIEPEDSSAGS